MKTLKKNLKNYRSVKTSSIANYKMLSSLLNKYEELNLKTYLGGETDNLMFANPSKPELKEKMENMVDNLRNPFEEFYHWCKSEIYDLEALDMAVASRDYIDKT